MSPKSLSKLRRFVETIDKKIISLLIARFRTTNQIQNLKREFGIKILQEKRERSLLKKYLNGTNPQKLPRELLKKLFGLIFSYSRKSDILKRSKWNKRRKPNRNP